MLPQASSRRISIPINWDWFSDSPVNQSEGDLVLQIYADSSYVVEHVLRRIEHEQAAAFTVIWTLWGEQRNGGQPRRATHRRYGASSYRIPRWSLQSGSEQPGGSAAHFR